MPVYTTAKIHGNTWQFTNTWQSIFLNILALSHPSILEFLCFLTLVVFFFICVLCFVEFLKLLLRNFLQKFSLTADICGLFSLHIMEGWKGLTGHNNLTEKKIIGCSLFQTHKPHLQLKKLQPAQQHFFHQTPVDIDCIIDGSDSEDDLPLYQLAPHCKLGFKN